MDQERECIQTEIKEGRKEKRRKEGNESLVQVPLWLNAILGCGEVTHEDMSLGRNHLTAKLKKVYSERQNKFYLTWGMLRA